MSDSTFFQNVELSSAHLRVHSLVRTRSFYQDFLGFRVVAQNETQAELSPSGSSPALVILEENTGAPPRPDRSEGLFHLAFLYPDRRSLGGAFRRLMDCEYSLDGASDHGVSEALYLTDPEGNGIELYADRPPAAWPRVGSNVEMFTAPLDLRSLVAGAGEATNDYAIPGDTRLGHVHLNALDLAEAEHKLSGELAMPLRQRGYPGALFFGYDEYHHHIAVNRWGIEQPAASGVLGLTEFTLTVRRHVADAVKVDDVNIGGVRIAIRR